MKQIVVDITRAEAERLAAELASPGEVEFVLRVGGRGASFKDDRTSTYVTRLIDRWNNSQPVAQSDGPRNRPVAPSDRASAARKLESVLQLYKVDELEQLMDEYIEACEQRRHVSGTRNKAYKTLVNWADKLRSTKDISNLWWRRGEYTSQDEVNNTIRAADIWAKKVLGRTRYGLNEGDSEFEHFLRAAKKAERRESKNYSFDDIISVAAKTAVELATAKGRTANPAILSESWLWKSEIPQRLKKSRSV